MRAKVSEQPGSALVLLRDPKRLSLKPQGAAAASRSLDTLADLTAPISTAGRPSSLQSVDLGEEFPGMAPGWLCHYPLSEWCRQMGGWGVQATQPGEAG